MCVLLKLIDFFTIEIKILSFQLILAKELHVMGGTCVKVQSTMVDGGILESASHYVRGFRPSLRYL